jgi:type IV secretion system protein VirD4
VSGLLGKMVGSHLESADDIDIAAAFTPPPAHPAPERRPGRALARAGKAAAPYAAAVGGVAAVSVIAGAPDWFTLMAMGGCVVHAGDRIAEGWFHHTKGGRFFERRRRKYQGEAGWRDVRGPLSVAAAQRKMARLAPDLPASQSHILLGTSVRRPQGRVGVTRAESILVVAPPQTCKTVFIGYQVMEAPGAALVTSSRADLWRNTVSRRERMGPVLTLDADGRGPGTNFGWNPLRGCENASVAMRRAGEFMQASPRDPSGKDSWHEARGRSLMQMAFHAAALVGESMYAARAWCQRPEDERFAKALRHPMAARGWGDTLETLLGEEPDFLNSATTSAEAALGWMDDPDLAAVACPRDGGLDVARFLRQGAGTVYLIGKHRAHGSLAPFFATFVSEYMEQATALAEAQGGRLRVPMTLALDEAATTARVDLAQYLAVTAGYNITAIVGLQSVSQLEAYWGGPAQAEIILDLMNTKVIGGGVTSPAALDRLAAICGEHRVWRKEGGRKVHETVRVFPPERIRMLPDLNALVVPRNAKPVQVRVPVIWEHPDYAPVTLADPDEGEFEAEEPPAPAVPLHIVGQTADAR